MKTVRIIVKGGLGRGLLSACLFVGICVFGLRARAEDLVVARGETVELAESKTYGTITVHGSLTVSGSAKVEATTVELGPNAGDNAKIEVKDASSCFGSRGTKITVGANGGMGCLVGPSAGGGGMPSPTKPLKSRRMPQ